MRAKEEVMWGKKKIKVFEAGLGDKGVRGGDRTMSAVLQEKVNRWLAKNSGIDIKEMHQSAAAGDMYNALFLTIYYVENESSKPRFSHPKKA